MTVKVGKITEIHLDFQTEIFNCGFYFVDTIIVKNLFPLTNIGRDTFNYIYSFYYAYSSYKNLGLTFLITILAKIQG